MIVEVDDDCADRIVVANLAWAYVSLSQDLKNPNKWHEDDIEHWKQLLPAIKLVGEWFSVDFNADIKKAKKK
jgi:hypothetical protein